MDMQDGARRESAVQFIPVEPAHVRWGELRQLDLAQGWSQVNPHELLVAFPGPPAYCVTHIVVEPAVQVLPDGHIPGVVGEPTVPVGQGAGKFLSHCCPCLAVDVALFDSLRGLYPILADPIAVFAAVD